MTSSKVPWRFGSSDCERGISSYQALKAAALAVDDQLQLARIARQVRCAAPARRISSLVSCDIRRASRAAASAVGVEVGEQRLQRLAVRLARPLAFAQRRLDEVAALDQLEAERQAGGVLLATSSRQVAKRSRQAISV